MGRLPPPSLRTRCTPRAALPVREWTPACSKLAAAWQLLLALTLVALLSGPHAVGGQASPSPALVPIPPPANCSAAAGTCVRIGYFNCPWGGTVCTNFVGHDRMYEWYRERIATKLGGRLVGVPVQWVRATISGFIIATAAEVYATVDRLFIGDAARNGAGQPLVDFVILPFGSLWDTAMQLLERQRIPSIGASSPDSKLFQCAPTADVWNITQPGCTAPNTRRYKYAHGASAPGELYFQPWVGLLKLRKARSIAMVRTVVPFYQIVRAGMLTAAADNAIPIVYDELVLLNTAVTPAALETSTVRRVMGEVRAVQPDALIFITQDCVPWILEMERLDYTPKSVAAVLCSDGSGPLADLGDRLRYIVGSSQWLVEQRGADSQEDAATQPWSLFPYTPGGLSSPMQFQALFRSLVNSSTIVPGYAEATVFAGLTFLEGAITLAGTVDPEKVQAQLLAYYQPSFYGLITTNRFGLNEQKRLIISQRDEFNILRIISPSSMSTHDFIYPMPRFSERVYTPAMLSSTIERVVIGLIAFCAAFTGALALLLYAHRRTQKFFVAGMSFRIYLLVALGCISACASILTWGVENNSASCGARLWTWTLSLHLFVDPMLAVVYRTARTFTVKLHEKHEISRAKLAAGCTALVVPQLLLNALWTALAPLRPTVVTEDPLRPAFTSFTSCDSDDATASTVFLALTLLYSSLLLLALCLLVKRVRRVRGLYSEARAIAVAVYLFVMTSIVVLVVQATLSHPDIESERVLFGLRSVGLLVAYQGCVVLLFLPRVLPLLPLLSARCVGCCKWNICATATADTYDCSAPRWSPSVIEAPLASILRPATSRSPHAGGPVRSVHFTLSPSDALSTRSQAQQLAGDSDCSAVALPLHVAALADARIPLPPREQLLALPLEETVAIVAHFHALIQLLRGNSSASKGNDDGSNVDSAAATAAAAAATIPTRTTIHLDCSLPFSHSHIGGAPRAVAPADADDRACSAAPPDRQPADSVASTAAESAPPILGLLRSAISASAPTVVHIAT